MDDLLKDAIADAKAVRETALANAKIALEEAFTPRIQSMLSDKIQSEIEDNDEGDYNEEEEMEKDEEEPAEEPEDKPVVAAEPEEGEEPSENLKILKWSSSILLIGSPINLNFLLIMSSYPPNGSIKFPFSSKYNALIVKSLLFASSYKVWVKSTDALLPKLIKSFLKLVIWYSLLFKIIEIVL